MKHDLSNDEQLPRKYLQFPLFLIRDMFNDKVGTINKIIKYGIYRMSKAIEYDLHNVARQTIFELYRGDLSFDIIVGLNSHNFEYVGKDENYNGFSGDVFNPDLEIDELLHAFSTDAELKARCIEFYCVRQTLSVLSMNTNSIERILQVGKEIERITPDNEVMPMIGKHTLFHFRDNDKTENEIAQLLAYIAIRSIIGKKAYTKTNKPHIIARMFGYSSVKVLLDAESNELVKKYCTRHHYQKILLSLAIDWNVCIYSNRTRGIYVSIANSCSLEKLIEIAEQKKRSKREADYLKMKRDAIDKVMNKISLTATNTTE
jgi:hypothetical protein